MTVQVQRSGDASWSVTRVTSSKSGEHLVREYELLGRVVFEGGRYHVDVPHWQDVGHAWHRLDGAGHLLMRAAVRALTDRERRAS